MIELGCTSRPTRLETPEQLCNLPKRAKCPWQVVDADGRRGCRSLAEPVTQAADGPEHKRRTNGAFSSSWCLGILLRHRCQNLRRNRTLLQLRTLGLLNWFCPRRLRSRTSLYRFDFSCSFDFTRTHRSSAALLPIQVTVSSTALGQNHRLTSPTTNTRVADQRSLLRRLVTGQFRLPQMPTCSANAHIAPWRSILHRSTTNTHTHRSSAELLLQSTRGCMSERAVVFLWCIKIRFYVVGACCSMGWGTLPTVSVGGRAYLAIEEPFHFVTIFPSAVVKCVHSLQRIGVYRNDREQYAGNLESLSFALKKCFLCYISEHTQIVATTREVSRSGPLQFANSYIDTRGIRKQQPTYLRTTHGHLQSWTSRLVRAHRLVAERLNFLLNWSTRVLSHLGHLVRWKWFPFPVTLALLRCSRFPTLHQVRRLLIPTLGTRLRFGTTYLRHHGEASGVPVVGLNTRDILVWTGADSDSFCSFFFRV